MVTSFVLRGHNFTFSTKNWEKLARYARMIAVCSFFLLRLCRCSHSSPSSEASSTLGPRQVLLKLIFFHYIFPAENSSRLSPVVPKYHLMWSETLYAIRVVWGGVKSILWLLALYWKVPISPFWIRNLEKLRTTRATLSSLP